MRLSTPIWMPRGPHQIENRLKLDGDGSRGSCSWITPRPRPPTRRIRPGYLFNVRYVNGKVGFKDVTTPGMDPLFTASQVKKWFYFPIR